MPRRSRVRTTNSRTMTARERILVTGAAGFIGSHVVDRLLARGAEVVGIDNFDPFYPAEQKRENLVSALQQDRFRLVQGDCRDIEVISDELGESGFDAVVHLAAKAGVRPSIADPVSYANVNVLGTQAILEYCRSRSIQRFVFASSSSVYGNSGRDAFKESDPVDSPVSPYAATKRSAELLCHVYHHLHGMHIIALRFFTAYGPRQRPDLAIRKFGELMLRGSAVPLFGDGTTARDYTWIDDICAGVIAAIDRTASEPAEFRVINLGENQTTTLKELVDLLAEALGVDPRIDWLPMQPGDVMRTRADVSLARELLGYRPATPIALGIQQFARWLQAKNGR